MILDPCGKNKRARSSGTYGLPGGRKRNDNYLWNDEEMSSENPKIIKNNWLITREGRVINNSL
jgi:hypothetical protein